MPQVKVDNRLADELKMVALLFDKQLSKNDTSVTKQLDELISTLETELKRTEIFDELKIFLRQGLSTAQGPSIQKRLINLLCDNNIFTNLNSHKDIYDLVQELSGNMNDIFGKVSSKKSFNQIGKEIDGCWQRLTVINSKFKAMDKLSNDEAEFDLRIGEGATTLSTLFLIILAILYRNK